MNNDSKCGKCNCFFHCTLEESRGEGGASSYFYGALEIKRKQKANRRVQGHVYIETGECAIRRCMVCKAQNN